MVRLIAHCGHSSPHPGLDVPLENGAVIFFALGSLVVTVGAAVDLGVVVRSGRRERAAPDGTGGRNSNYGAIDGRRPAPASGSGEAWSLVRS